MCTRFLRLVVLLFVLFSFTVSVFANVEISSSLTKKTLVQGGRTELHVEISWIGDPNSIEITPPKSPDCYLMEVEQIKQTNTFELFPDKGLNRINFVYSLKALEPGEGRVSSFVVEVTEKETGIKSIKKTDAYDIKILTKLRYILRQILKTGLVALFGFFIFVVVVVAVYLRKKNKRQKEAQESMSVCSDYDNQVLNELKSILKYKVTGETYKFFDQLSTILNRFFNKKLHIYQSDGKDSREIPSKIIIEFKEIIAGCNNIKFSAKKMTPSDLESWYRRAEKLIRFFIKKSEHDAREQQMKNINTIKDGGV